MLASAMECNLSVDGWYILSIRLFCNSVGCDCYIVIQFDEGLMHTLYVQGESKKCKSNKDAIL